MRTNSFTVANTNTTIVENEKPAGVEKPADNEKPADDKSSPAVGGQTDGAPEALGGSLLHEPEYDVDVKLSDLQADPNNPLYSVKAFEDLGLWVDPPGWLNISLADSPFLLAPRRS